MLYTKPKIICYDFDDTLVAMEQVYMDALNILCEKYHIPLRTKKDMKVINKSKFTTVLAALFGEKFEPQIHAEYEFGYSACSHNLVYPLSGALEFVQYAYHNGIYQAIISNKPRHIVLPEVKRLGFAPYMHAIVGAHDGHKKPDKEMFKMALDEIKSEYDIGEFDVNPSTVWMFGDSSSDAIFAKNINAKIFFVDDKWRIPHDIPDNLIADFTAFQDIQFY